MNSSYSGSSRNNQLLSDGSYWYAYDPEGNRTARWIDGDQNGLLDAADTDITQYAWDNRNRLTEVSHFADFATLGESDPDSIVDYLYDAENRWIGRTIDSNGDGTIDHQTRFAYDGNQIVLEFDKDLVGSGEHGAANQLTVASLSHRYLWQPDAVDQLMAEEQLLCLPEGGEGQGGNGRDKGYDLSQPGEVLWALADQQGTVRDMAKFDATTGATAVVDHIMYDSFGKVVSESNPAEGCLFKYTGRATDTATDIEFHDQRVKVAGSADWLSVDPSLLYGGDTNTRRYCFNSPTNATDPSGLAPLGWPSWHDYTFYLWNPSREDKWCRYGQVGALGVSAVAGAAAGGLAAAGLGGVTVSQAAAAVTGAGAKVYVVGTLTGAEIQQLISSSGDKIVTVFSRITQSPASNRILYAATDPKLPNAITRGSMYIGKIPKDLFDRLVYEGEIWYETTMMGDVSGKAVVFSAKAMEILHPYFSLAGPNGP